MRVEESKWHRYNIFRLMHPMTIFHGIIHVFYAQKYEQCREKQNEILSIPLLQLYRPISKCAQRQTL